MSVASRIFCHSSYFLGGRLRLFGGSEGEAGVAVEWLDRCDLLEGVGVGADAGQVQFHCL